MSLQIAAKCYKKNRLPQTPIPATFAVVTKKHAINTILPGYIQTIFKHIGTLAERDILLPQIKRNGGFIRHFLHIYIGANTPLPACR